MLTSAHYVCLVNKIVRTFTEPLLYSKIVWIWEDSKSSPPITQLLRTLVCRPQLSSYITSLHLGGHVGSLGASHYGDSRVPNFSIDMDKLIAFIQGTRVRFSDVWIKGVSKGKTDALVAVLLAQLSNLRYLNLESAFVERSEFIGMLLRSAIYEPADHLLPEFRHLQEVYFRPTLNCHNRNDKSVKNTEDVLPFFHLPNVERMKVVIQPPVHFTENAPRPPVSSRLKALDLTAIRESYLCKVLSISKSVTNLRWEMYYDSGIEDEVNPPIVDLDSLGAAISHVRDTLEDLTIIGSVDLRGGDQFDPAVQIKGSLHALVSMHKLSRLQIPLAFLVGFTEDITKRV